MPFKTVMAKVRKAILCSGREERKHCLEIGSPTDVRRIDVGESILGLSINDKPTISSEKPTKDHIRLLSLQSHPPNQPPSIYSLSLPPSREPSHTLLNAASSNLPSTLPTPPSHKYSDGSPPPPSHRMKTMWERTRRLSSSLSLSNRSSCGYQEFDMLNTNTRGVAALAGAGAGAGTGVGTGAGTGAGTEVKTGGDYTRDAFLLDMVDLDFKNGGITTPDSPVSLNGSERGTSVEGEFEMRNKKVMIERAIGDTDCSDSEGETVVADSERKRLV